MKFIGTVNAKLDAKGRVFFPAAFRKLLAEGDENFVLRRDLYEPCLVLYPLKVWEEEVAALRQRINRWNPREALVLRQFLADAEVITLDGSGRFLLTRRMLQLANLEKEIVFLGADDRIELWSKEKMAEPFLSAEDFGTALQQIMASKEAPL